MRYFAVLDTNVLVSALLSSSKNKESNPLKVIRYVFTGLVHPVYNDDILEEYREFPCAIMLKQEYPVSIRSKLYRAKQDITKVNIDSFMQRHEEEHFSDNEDIRYLRVKAAKSKTRS